LAYDVWEIFDCLEWELVIPTTLTLETHEGTQSITLQLKPGQTPPKWKGIKVTVTATIPVASSLNLKFIRSEGKVGIISENLYSVITQLHCPSKAEAEKFECSFNEDACTCERAEKSVSCECASSTEAFEHTKAHFLPQKIESSHWIDAVGDSVEAKIPPNGLEIIVAADGLKTRAAFDGSHCDLETTILSGCFACAEGALMHAKCTTNFGTALAHVECSHGAKFSIQCAPYNQATNQSIGLLLNEGVSELKCNVQCPASSTSLYLKAQLSPPKLQDMEAWASATRNTSTYDGNGGHSSFVHDVIQTLTTLGAVLSDVGSHIFQNYKLLFLALMVVPIIIILCYCSVLMCIPRIIGGIAWRAVKAVVARRV
jgi:hypothetical protein